MIPNAVSRTTRTVLIMLAIGALSGAAVAAERTVLGEYFTATW